MNGNIGATFLKAGVIPLPAWLILTTIAGFFAADYSPVASHVSVMTLQDSVAHLLVNIAALITGVTLIVFGVGVWARVPRVFSAGALCWILFGFSMVANGIWPMGGPMHGLYIIGIFNILAPALTLLDIKDAEIQTRLHMLTVFVSLASVFYIWLLLNGFDPEGYTGLTQRIFASIGYFWPLAFAVQIARLRQI